MTTVYLAGPLFSIAEREFNRCLADSLAKRIPGLKTILPQDRARTLLAQPNGMQLVFRDCLEMIEQSDIIVSVLDGADVDSGTSIELGYAFAKGIPIIGLRTDFRGSEDRGLNLMVSHVCKELVVDLEHDTEALAEAIAVTIRRIYK